MLIIIVFWSLAFSLKHFLQYLSKDRSVSDELPQFLFFWNHYFFSPFKKITLLDIELFVIGFFFFSWTLWIYPSTTSGFHCFHWVSSLLYYSSLVSDKSFLSFYFQDFSCLLCEYFLLWCICLWIFLHLSYLLSFLDMKLLFIKNVVNFQ